MNISYRNQSLEIASKEELDAFWRGCQQELSERREFISHIDYNGVQLEGDYLEFLEQHIESREQKVRIHVDSIQRLVSETGDSITSYMATLLARLEEISAPFYGSMSKEDWLKFEELLSGLQWLQQAVFGLLPWVNLSVQESLTSFSRDLEEVSQGILRAMEWESHIAIGDSLLYELQPVLEGALTVLLQEERQV